MKVFITGATGLVGSHLVDLLVSEGHDVNVLIRKTSNTKYLEGKPVKIFYGDITQPETLEAPLKEVEYVVHSAAVLTAPKYETYYKVNVEGTKNVLEAILKHNPNIKRLVFISTQAAFGPAPSKDSPIKEDVEPKPLSAYAETKLKAEEIVRENSSKIPTTILRPSAIYGPRDKEFYPLFQMAKRGMLIKTGTKEHYINLLYVIDFIHMIYEALGRDDIPSGEAFFVHDGNVYSYTQIYETLKQVVNRPVLIISVPEFIAKWVGAINSAVSNLTGKAYILNKDKVREMLQLYWLMDNSKYLSVFKYRPKTSLKEGFEITYKWYIENKWL